MKAFRALSRILRACAVCGYRGGIGAPTVIADVREGAPIYGCAKHARSLASPPRELIERLAQLRDLRQRGGHFGPPEEHGHPDSDNLRIEGARHHP